MSKRLWGLAFVAVVVSPAGWAADGPSAPPTSLSASTAIFDEAHFLRSAEDAAKAGDKEGAVQLYQSAIIYAPGDPVPYERLAELYVTSGQVELAQQYFGLALDAAPAYAPALQGLAMLQLAAGNRAGAQAQHDLLLRSCGVACPETAKVGEALGRN